MAMICVSFKSTYFLVGLESTALDRALKLPFAPVDRGFVTGEQGFGSTLVTALVTNLLLNPLVFPFNVYLQAGLAREFFATRVACKDLLFRRLFMTTAVEFFGELIAASIL